MNFEQTNEFRKDLKRLGKKYRSLPDDLDGLCKVLSHARPRPRRNHTALIKQVDGVSIWKMRLFCEYLKGKALRVVFAYYEDGSGVGFIELFHKSDRQRESVARYESFLKDLVEPLTSPHESVRIS